MIKRLLTAFIALSLATACNEPEQTYCYQCTVTGYYLSGSSNQYTSTSWEVNKCDLTEAQGNDLQSSLFTSKKYSDGSVASTKAICNKK